MNLEEFKVLGKAARSAMMGLFGLAVIFGVLVYAVVQLPNIERLVAIGVVIIGILFYKEGSRRMVAYNDFIRGLQDEGKLPK